VAADDLRDRLECSFRYLVEAFKGHIVGDQVSKINVRIRIDGAERGAATFPPGQHVGTRPECFRDRGRNPTAQRVVAH
jgi:hypothetical protein